MPIEMGTCVSSCPHRPKEIILKEYKSFVLLSIIFDDSRIGMKDIDIKQIVSSMPACRINVVYLCEI